MRHLSNMFATLLNPVLLRYLMKRKADFFLCIEVITIKLANIYFFLKKSFREELKHFF